MKVDRSWNVGLQLARMKIRRIAAMALAIVAVTSLTASPASAFPYGEVTNATGGAVAIVNCWQGSSGSSQVGISPYCDGFGGNVPYNNNAKPAWRWLAPGLNSDDHLSDYWDDVDAFRVEAGCVTNTNSGAYTAYDWSPKWYKISDPFTLRIISVVCG